jgi:3-phosphoshikimate 1-carboxyvinyltransferase
VGPVKFHGPLPASKSLFNRALIIKSFAPDLELSGQSSADDVVLLAGALDALSRGEKKFQVGAAGTALRFLALRLAREKGRFEVYGSDRLFSRLPQALLKTLRQLGAEAEFSKDMSLIIESDGWRLRGDGLWIPTEDSSQFASAVVLSAWNLPFSLHMMRTEKARGSEGYFQMTLELVRSFGMTIDVQGPEISIPAKQLVRRGVKYAVECDVSSAFSVAAYAAVGGECVIDNFPRSSGVTGALQPDMRFVQFFVQMGIDLKQDSTTGALTVTRTAQFSGLDADLRDCPDLFPVLAVLLSFATSPSRLTGLSALAHKESNRLENTVRLVRALGAQVVVDGIDGGSISLQPLDDLALTRLRERKDPIIFDPDHDHRMAMAAAVAKAAGAPVQILDSEVVTKSFPGFWEAVGLEPVTHSQ